jgi:hypothetical protein
VLVSRWPDYHSIICPKKESLPDYSLLNFIFAGNKPLHGSRYTGHS